MIWPFGLMRSCESILNHFDCSSEGWICLTQVAESLKIDLHLVLLFNVLQFHFNLLRILRVDLLLESNLNVRIGVSHSTHRVLVLECVWRAGARFLDHHARSDDLSWRVSQHGVVLGGAHVTIVGLLRRFSFDLAVLLRSLIWIAIRIVVSRASLISNVDAVFLLKSSYMHFGRRSLLRLVKTLLILLLVSGSYDITTKDVSTSIQTDWIDINWDAIIYSVSI